MKQKNKVEYDAKRIVKRKIPRTENNDAENEQVCGNETKNKVEI